MDTRPSAVVPQDYHEIPDLCEKNAEPSFPMKYDKDDLVVMDIETYSRREKMRKLREELLAVEEIVLKAAMAVPLTSLTPILTVSSLQRVSNWQMLSRN